MMREVRTKFHAVAVGRNGASLLMFFFPTTGVSMSNRNIGGTVTEAPVSNVLLSQRSDISMRHERSTCRGSFSLMQMTAKQPRVVQNKSRARRTFFFFRI